MRCPRCQAVAGPWDEVCGACGYLLRSAYGPIAPDASRVPLAGDSAGDDESATAGSDRRLQGRLGWRDPVGAGLKLFWGGVAVVLLLGAGWLTGWHSATAPVRATLQGLNALQRQLLAGGGSPTAGLPSAQTVAAQTGGLPTAIRMVWVHGVSLPIPAGWHVADTTTDYNPLQVDATDAITVQHLQERSLPGGGFVAWGSGVAGPYWQAEVSLGNGTNAVVVAVP